MDFWQVMTLALIQGLTEFLPVSSSAHLILVPYFAEWPDQGLTFDVAVHVGTLGAVLIYFRRELAGMATDWWRSLAARRPVGQSRMLWLIIGATVPVGVAGLAMEIAVPDGLRSPMLIAAATIGFGLLLWWADATGSQKRDQNSIAWRDAFLIGLAQALALIPGTSRSGITITAGLLLGLDRSSAARFSFLLSIPVIALAGGLKLYSAVGEASAAEWNDLLVGAGASFLSAYLCIHFFLKLIARMSMLPFIAYRLLLGVVVIAVAL